MQSSDSIEGLHHPSKLSDSCYYNLIMLDELLCFLQAADRCFFEVSESISRSFFHSNSSLARSFLGLDSD